MESVFKNEKKSFIYQFSLYVKYQWVHSIYLLSLTLALIFINFHSIVDACVCCSYDIYVNIFIKGNKIFWYKSAIHFLNMNLQCFFLSLNWRKEKPGSYKTKGCVMTIHGLRAFPRVAGVLTLQLWSTWFWWCVKYLGKEKDAMKDRRM